MIFCVCDRCLIVVILGGSLNKSVPHSLRSVNGVHLQREEDMFRRLH
jgi:hypothetical protein